MHPVAPERWTRLPFVRTTDDASGGAGTANIANQCRWLWASEVPSPVCLQNRCRVRPGSYICLRIRHYTTHTTKRQTKGTYYCRGENGNCIASRWDALGYNFHLGFLRYRCSLVLSVRVFGSLFYSCFFFVSFQRWMTVCEEHRAKQ